MMSLQERGDLSAKLCPCSMQQHSDYHLGSVEHPGDFEIAVPFKVFEHDDLGRLWTKRSDGSPDLSLKFAIDVLSLRIWLGAFGRGGGDFFDGHRAGAGPAAQQI